MPNPIGSDATTSRLYSQQRATDAAAERKPGNAADGATASLRSRDDAASVERGAVLAQQARDVGETRISSLDQARSMLDQLKQQISANPQAALAAQGNVSAAQVDGNLALSVA